MSYPGVEGPWLSMHVRDVQLHYGQLARLKVHVQAVYGVLKEAEHRSTFYIPYWNIPITRYIVPRQRKFRADLEVINDCLDGLIARAKQTRQADDVEALQARDYSKACSAHSPFVECAGPSKPGHGPDVYARLECELSAYTELAAV